MKGRSSLTITQTRQEAYARIYQYILSWPELPKEMKTADPVQSANSLGSAVKAINPMGSSRFDSNTVEGQDESIS